MLRIHSFKVCSALVIVALANCSASTVTAAQQGAVKIQIVVDGMCCQGCAQKIAAQMYAVPGVHNVEANVPNHVATVTFKPSPKLTLERLWLAAEKGDGKPSKLVTSEATYTLQRPEQLQLAEPLAPGRFWVVAASLESREHAQRIAKQLYAVRGVKTVQIDMQQRMFFLESATPAPVSPWSLASAVAQAGNSAESITGPHGVLTIERAAKDKQSTAILPTYPQTQGEVR
jgi:copper chaperone CopZ